MRLTGTKRAVCLLLVCLMAIAAAACATAPDDVTGETTPATQDTTTAPQQGDAETTPVETTTAYEEDNIDAGLNFGGEVINFLYWQDSNYEEFYSEGMTGDLINDAIYQRNTSVEERLGVDFNFIGADGNEYNEAAFTKKVSSSISAGDHEFDLIGAYSYTGGLCAAQGLLCDLSDVENLDFEKPWWSEMLIKQSTVNNKIFFVSGDISANAIYMMYVTFFNKDILSGYGLEDPYGLVNSGKWTIDKQFEMASVVYEDLNGNGTKDTGDKCGLYIYTLHYDSFLWGSNIFIIDSFGDTATYSVDFMGEKTVDLQAKIKDFVFDNQGGLAVTDKNQVHQYFANGLSLFWNDRCCRAVDFAATSLNYGIVPVAKYNEAQESYVTIMGNAFTLYCLPKDVEDADMMGAVVECMASESYRTVTPALFEESFKYKYSQDDNSAKMFDIARGTVVTDLSRIFSNTLNAYKSWQKAIVGSAGWSSTVKSNQRTWEKQLELMLEIYE